MSESSQTRGGAAGAPPEGAGGPPVSERSRPWRTLPVRQTALVGSFIAMVLFFCLQEPSGFATADNAKVLLNTLPILGMLAISVTIVLVLGEFDLSVTSVAALVTVVIAILVSQTGIAVLLAILVGLGVGAMFGTVNGLAVGYGRASAFVVTLAVGSVAAGFEVLVQGRINLGQTSIARLNLPDSLRQLTDTHIFGLELAVFVLLAVAIVLALVLVHTPWGRHVQAIGGNEMAAQLAGVAVRRTKVIAFTLTGVAAATAGLLFVVRNGYYSNAMPGFLLPAYAAAFFGAAAVGKRGFSVPATLFGTLYLATLANGLSVMNQPTWVVSVVQGAVLFTTVLIAKVGTRR